MRLRLRIHRNELPAVSTLWPVSETQLKQTISHLLAAVNTTFPLETEQWGLEDYVVLISGFECLHYHELSAVCKDEDEVTIRPLQYAEVRARTLLGRAQISGDGRHLVDGVPFGRPLIRAAPQRPEVRIPARKRLRIAEPDDEGFGGEEMVQFAYGQGPPLEERIQGNGGDLMRLEELRDELDSEDEEDDGDFQLEYGDSDEVALSGSDVSSDGDSSDTSDTSSEDCSSSDGETSASEKDSDHSSGASSSDESWNGIQSPSNPSTSSKSKAASTSDGSTSMQQADSKSLVAMNGSRGSADKRKHNAIDDATTLSVETSTGTGLPYQGKSTTRERNARRRDTKKLAHLKKVGVLHLNANLQDLRKWELDGVAARHDKPGNVLMHGDDVLGVDTLDGVSDGAGILGAGEETSTSTLDNLPKDNAQQDKNGLNPKNQRKLADDAFEKQRQQLLDALSGGGVDVSEFEDTPQDQNDAPEEMSSKQPVQVGALTSDGTSAAVTAASSAPGTVPTAMVPPSVARRSKLDLAGSKRLLFGSLGVRVPKTQEQRDKVQKKLAGLPKTQLNGGASAIPQTQVRELASAEPDATDDEDPEAWRHKIKLTAVECCEEGIILSTPPFPFHQRWDPQQRGGKRKKAAGAAYMASKKKRKGGGDQQYYVETYDKYNTSGYGDELDYDGLGDDEYWEEGALLDDEGFDEDDMVQSPGKQLRSEAAFQAQKVEDDCFPSLPADLSALPQLAEAEAKVNDFIVYNELVCSAATSWQPQTLVRTAQLLSRLEGHENPGNGGNTWRMRMALRDRPPPKEYDEEGRRVYTKFEMEGLSDDEEGDEGADEEGSKIVKWEGLGGGEVKLLERPANLHTEEMTEGS